MAAARRFAPIAAVALCVFAGLVGTAPPAGAHATGGLPATNWRSAVTGLRPANGWLHARTTDLANHLELRVEAGHDVVVSGYSGEPYLRFDAAGGVDENERSPATFLNRSATLPSTLTPATYDARATPVWKRIAAGHVWRWHDHRVHHTAGDAGAHAWVVPLRVDGQAGVIAGRITYAGASAPVVPIVLGLIGFALGVLVDRARRVTLMFSALALGSIVLLIGIARFGTGGALHDIGGIVYASIAAAGATGAPAWAAHRPQSWSPGALLGGLAVLIAGGFTFATWITHSQLPVALPGVLARTVVAMLIGAAAGIVVSAVRHLQPDNGSTPHPIGDAAAG